MGKAEIVHRIAEETNLTHAKAEEVVEAILHEIKTLCDSATRSSRPAVKNEPHVACCA